MRRTATLVALAYFCLAGYGSYRSLHPRLPHRPVTALTNWGQGHAPESNRCPSGTIRIETDEGLFLECFRGTN